MGLMTGSIRVAALTLLLAGATPALIPTAFRFDATARPELRQLWEASLSAKAERVACLAGSIESDTVRISPGVSTPSRRLRFARCVGRRIPGHLRSPKLARHRAHPRCPS